MLLWAALPLYAAPVHSTAWGFSLDLPEGYEYADGNRMDRYSFMGPNEARFDIRVYNGQYAGIQPMAEDVNYRLGNQGPLSVFVYNGKQAALMELDFSGFKGWGLCVELGTAQVGGHPPMMLALSYAPAASGDMDLFHMSALDSIIPSGEDRYYPGPVMEFGFPRGEQKKIDLAMPGLSALIRENDAEAAQVLVDREFALLRKYFFAENWQKAWIRFYRAIYRDSWNRLTDALFQLERNWNAPANGQGGEAAGKMDNSQADRALAEKALAWVQGFTYERDLMGSDFVNLVSAVTEGRGDCDSRAMLWAMILAQADIPAAIMVSREYSHAMGLADIPGAGARFEAGGVQWLVAETTAPVALGLIEKDQSAVESWLGVLFE
jgi:hypothetical protein